MRQIRRCITLNSALVLFEQILNAAYQVEITVRAGASLVRVLLEKMKQVCHIPKRCFLASLVIYRKRPSKQSVGIISIIFHFHCTHFAVVTRLMDS